MIGVIGGSGFYTLLADERLTTVDTPYGAADVAIGAIGEKKVVFIARHGMRHDKPPHKLNYKANIHALHTLGVKHIISVTAVGSLRKDIMPGDFVVPSTFFNATHGRDDTFYHGPDVFHISSTPYCPQLSAFLAEKASEIGTVHENETVVVINGPRFASKAESDFYQKVGGIINMTQYPENVLARERQMCYGNISIVTDYDAGLKDDPTIEPVTADEVARVFKENSERIKALVMSIIENMPEPTCDCGEALKTAKLN